jgi:hypothetical protein
MSLNDKLEEEFSKPPGERDIDLVFMSLQEEDEILAALRLMITPLREHILKNRPNKEGRDLLSEYNGLYARAHNFVKQINIEDVGKDTTKQS